MVFSSVTFLLLFLPLFLLLYYIVPQKFKNSILLLGSIFFYSWGAPRFIFVILLVTFVDFHLVHFMYDSTKELQRKLLLSLSVSINLSFLIYFKYSNFFVENVNALLYSAGIKQIVWTKLILPIGISFYTFESLTYVVDVYRRIHKPLDKFWDYQLYIILFPKLIAGPIVRYHEIADQITDRTQFDFIEYKLSGFVRFCSGLAKKVIIANVLAIQADSVFSMPPGNLSSALAWSGILSYTFQIYFDFSGYSDMAIGIGQMIGFKFPENFKDPYISQSVTEFWRRWHITLGKWMKNYLYIPLGGNKVKSKSRMYMNLWIVFIASGFWHGASWNFIVWGMYHGFFLVMERMFLLKFLEKTGKWLSICFTFVVIVIGWVFFRTENLSSAFLFIRQLFAFDFRGHLFLDNRFYFCLSLAVLISFLKSSDFGVKIHDWICPDVLKMNTIRLIVLSISALFLFSYSLSAIASSSFNPFIYFRF